MTRGRAAVGWWGTAVVFVAAGIWLRAYQLDLQVVLDDEWHAVHKLLSANAREILRTFGIADHSIPLTLAYRWLALHGGLDDWTLRTPQLAASCTLLLALPWLLRREGSAAGLALATGLLAVSPLAIHFAKLARPYALTMLLAPLAVVAFYRAWHAPSPALRVAWGTTYVASAFLSAWLHTVTLAFVLAPFVWFGVEALAGLRTKRTSPATRRLLGRQSADTSVESAIANPPAVSQSRSLPLRRLLAAGVPLAILLAAALGPPVSHDWSALAVKSGKDVVSLEALGRATMMLAGTRHPAVAGLVAALAVAGVVTLQRRSPPVRRLVRYLLACCVLLAVAVIASGAMYIHHPLVLARYLLPFLPLLCWFAGEGAVAIAGALAAAGRRAARDSWPQSAEGSVPRPLPAAALAIAGVGALALQGPLPVILAWPNQFIGHLRYQFDYDPRWNPYERLAVGIDIPGFYRELARRPPMSTAIVEMPWRLESHYNPLPWYQEVHRQRVMIGMVGGVCGPRSWGEYPPDGRIRFRNFIHLADILAGRPVNAELLVIHRRSWAIDRDTTIEWPDMRGCLPQIVAKLGPPLADDGDLAVFRLAGRLPAGAAPASASPVTAAPASAAPAGLSLPGESPAGFPRGDADDRLRNGRGG